MEIKPSTVLFIAAFAFAVVTTYAILPSAYVHWQDETQIMEMARGGIVDKPENWSMTSFGDTGLDSQSWAIFYVGGWILEHAYLTFGELGSRGVTITFLFLSTLLLWWYLRRKAENDWVAMIVALIWCAYPQFPVSVRGGRVDIIALTFVLVSLSILQFRPKTSKGKLVLFAIAGGFAAVAQFTWITVFMLAPIVLFEMLEFFADEHEPLYHRVALLAATSVGFAIVALLLFLPFLTRLDRTIEIFKRVIEVNTSQAKTHHGLLWREFLRCFFVFPGFYALGLCSLFVIPRTRLLAGCVALLAAISIATRIYEWRMLYFLPYAIIGAALLAAHVKGRGVKIAIFSLLGIMLMASFARTYLFRNLCDYYAKDARDYGRVMKVVEREIGHGVKIYNDCYELYLAGRALGWRQQRVYLNRATEVRKKMLAENDMYIGGETSVSAEREIELVAAGYVAAGVIDCSCELPGSRVARFLFSTGRCSPVYGRYVVWTKR